MISMDLAIVFIGMLRYTVPVNRKTKPAETGKEVHSMKNNTWKEIGVELSRKVQSKNSQILSSR